MRRWFLSISITLLLGGCVFSSWGCPTGADCNNYAPPEFLGVWQAEAPGATFSRFVISGSVNNWYAEVQENCSESSCRWGRVPLIGYLVNDSFPNDSKFKWDAMNFNWLERTPKVMQEFWLLEDNRGVLKTFIEKPDGRFDLGAPDFEDIMTRVNARP